MIIALLHLTLTEYLRDFFFGALEEVCSGTCPVCRGALETVSLRLRKVQDLPVYRVRCLGQCRKRFTLLPLFVAPAKWFGYSQIQESLEFVTHPKFRTVTDGILEWDYRRDQRIDGGLSPDPSPSTVRRWMAELSQVHPHFSWEARARKAMGPPPEINSVGGPKGKPGPDQIKVRPSSGPTVGVRFLQILRCLGEFLLGPSHSPPNSWLGVSLWFLESRFGQRILARANLVGRVIPGPSPFLAVTRRPSCTYPPEPSPPP